MSYILNKQLNAIYDDLEIVDERSQQNETDIDVLETNVGLNGSSLTILQTNVDLNTSNITTLQNDVVGINSNITTLQTNVDLNTSNITALQSVVFIHRYRTNTYDMTGGSQFIQFNSVNNSKIGSHLQVAGPEGTRVLISGWYRVSWSIAFRRLSQEVSSIQRHQIRTFVSVNNAFTASAGSIGSTTYLRSSSICSRGHSVGTNLMYVQANEVIKIGANGCLETELSWNSTFLGTRVESGSTFQVELVSEDTEN